jgi:hypothetical protein
VRQLFLGYALRWVVSQRRELKGSAVISGVKNRQYKMVISGSEKHHLIVGSEDKSVVEADSSIAGSAVRGNRYLTERRLTSTSKTSIGGQTHRREIRRVESDTCRVFGKRFSGHRCQHLIPVVG